MSRSRKLLSAKERARRAMKGAVLGFPWRTCSYGFFFGKNPVLNRPDRREHPARCRTTPIV